MPQGPDRLIECLNYISREVSANPGIDEDELYNIIRDSEFFKILGFLTVGRDVRQQKTIPGSRKKPDFYCTDDYQNVIFVIEAKRPSDPSLEGAFDQLWNRYVLPLKSKFGILTNGNQMIVYRRHDREASHFLTIITANASKDQAETLWSNLKKPLHEISVFGELKRYLATTEQISLRDEIAKENFLETFELKQETVFGTLVTSLMSVFDYALTHSKFMRGAYSFWLHSLARIPEHVPENWKPFLQGKPEDHIYRFMFSVETSHALLARLMLAKACQDYQFPDVNVYDFMQTNVPHVREHIPSVGYPLTVTRLLSEMRGLLVSSVFEDDIFGWWSDIFKEYEQYPAWKLEEEELDERLTNFCGALADLVLTLYKYNYFDLEADVLGDLYQTYFDSETRKALGEFYTPDEVVEYILDSVGYQKVLRKRLIDPSCGSGTFLVRALRRYLAEVKQNQGDRNFSQLLKNLCSSPRIVGLDVHPFAVLISQVRFMLELLPLYKAALLQGGQEGFRLQRLPIFRTDSLSIETLPDNTLALPLFVKTEKELRFSIALPMTLETDRQVTIEVAIPPWNEDSLQFSNVLNNLDDYFQASQGLFDALKEAVITGRAEVGIEGLRKSMRNYLTYPELTAICSLYKPYADRMLADFAQLRSDLEDGRLLKSIEEAVLAALLKNYFSYDFVVANPPYVRVQRLPERFRQYLRENYVTAYKKFDLFVVFMEKGIQWLSHSGRMGYIVSNRYINREYGGRLRALITSKCTIDLCIDFGDSGVFEDATNYPSIIVLTKGKEQNQNLEFVRVKKSSVHVLNTIARNLPKKNYTDDIIEIYSSRQPRSGASAWRFHRADIAQLIEKIEKNSNHELGDISKQIDEGIKTGADKVFVVDEDTASKQKLEKEVLKPVLRGEGVRRWKLKWTGDLLIYTHGLGNENSPVQLEDYPNTSRYLEQHRKILESRKYYGRTMAESARKFYELWNPDSSLWNADRKILTPNISNKNNFALDRKRYFALGSVHAVLLRSQSEDFALYVLGLLNSNVLDFYFRNISPFMQGRYFRYDTQFLQKIPLVFPEDLPKDPIASRIVHLVRLVLTSSEPAVNFPERHYSSFKQRGLELDVVNVSLGNDHFELNPEISAKLNKDYFVYPGEGEDPVWLESKERAEYVALALKGRTAKAGDLIEILMPREKKWVIESLEEFRRNIKGLTQAGLERTESELNHLVSGIYGLNSADVQLITEFLAEDAV